MANPTKQHKLFSAKSMDADGYSQAFDLQMVKGWSIHLKWIGTPTGSIIFQVSGDNPTTWTSQPSDWITLDKATLPLIGTADSALVQHSHADYRFIRVGYIFTSGTGTLNAILTCKS